MRKSCVQAVHDGAQSGSTTTLITHMAGYIYSASVYKPVAYARKGLNFIPLRLTAYTQLFNRLITEFIPTIHSPYKNKGKLLLDKYIIGGTR